MFALSYGSSWNQLHLAECSSSLNSVTVGAAERKAGFIPRRSRLGVQLPVSCRAPRPQPPPERCCSRSCSAGAPASHTAPCGAQCIPSSLFFGGLSCRKDRIGAPLSAGVPRCVRPEPPLSGAVPAARPAPLSPQRYLKGLVDISRVGWAVWVGFPVLEVSCSRPSAVPPSRRVPLSPRRRDPHPPGSLLSGWIYIVMCKLQDAQQHWKEV